MSKKVKKKKKFLGCWCKPEGCHGDILLELSQELNNPTTKVEEAEEKKQDARRRDRTETNKDDNDEFQ